MKNIFTTLLRRGKLDASRKFADGSRLEFDGVYALDAAYANARATTGRPTIIIVDGNIGWGSPEVQDKSKAHGEPLGAAEIARSAFVALVSERVDRPAAQWPFDPLYWNEIL